jgi:hypothetical protein
VDEVERAKICTKSKVRAKTALAKAGVEHPIGIIKRVFGFAKVRYRGLKKECSSLARDLRPSQFVYGAPASIALSCGVVCPPWLPRVVHGADNPR